MKRTITKRTSEDEATVLNLAKIGELIFKRYQLAQKLIKASDAGKSTTRIEIQLDNVTDRLKREVLFDTVKSKSMEYSY